jgi:hypothetical protein
MIRDSSRHFIVFCDDLSFDGQDAAYKSLKAVLDGGIEGRPDNRTSAPQPSIRPKPSKRRSRCRIASACGSASTMPTRTRSSP